MYSTSKSVQWEQSLSHADRRRKLTKGSSRFSQFCEKRTQKSVQQCPVRSVKVQQCPVRSVKEIPVLNSRCHCNFLPENQYSHAFLISGEWSESSSGCLLHQYEFGRRLGGTWGPPGWWKKKRFRQLSPPTVITILTELHQLPAI
jgi:hypothetical protein